MGKKKEDIVPQFMKVNPYVIEGYRTNCIHSVSKTLKSLFTLHNETWNIWTHLIASMCFAVLFYYSYSWGDPVRHSGLIDRIVMNLYVLCCVMTFFLSSFYHLCNCYSETAMHKLCTLDISGIAIVIIASIIPGVYFTFECYPFHRYSNLIVLFSFLILILCFSSILADRKYGKGRTIIFTSMALYGLLPIFQWFYHFGYQSELVSQFVIRLLVVYLQFIIGAIFYYTKVPEKWYPGYVTSVWINSHGLWHIFVVLGCSYLFVIGWDFYDYFLLHAHLYSNC